MRIFIKYILVIFFILGFISAKSQDFVTEDNLLTLKPGTKGMVKSNPLPILMGPGWFTSEFRLVYEKPVNLNQSFMIGASYLGKGLFIVGLLDTMSDQLSLRGFRFQLAYKFYLIDEAPVGFYIAPYFSYSKVYILEKSRQIYNSDYIEISFFNFNAIAGYQFVEFSGFVIDTFVGFGYKDNSWYDSYDHTGGQYAIFQDSPISHIKFTLGINFGYAF